MIVSEVNALASLLGTAGSFADYVKDGWCKSSTELSTFSVKVKTLSRKHKERQALLRKFDLSDDLNLSSFVEEAEKIITEEQARAIGLQKGKWQRFKSRAFPGRLTAILKSMEEKVDADFQLLKARVEANGLLEQLCIILKVHCRSNVTPPMYLLQSRLQKCEQPWKIRKALEYLKSNK